MRVSTLLYWWIFWQTVLSVCVCENIQEPWARELKRAKRHITKGSMGWQVKRGLRGNGIVTGPVIHAHAPGDSLCPRACTTVQSVPGIGHWRSRGRAHAWGLYCLAWPLIVYVCLPLYVPGFNDGYLWYTRVSGLCMACLGGSGVGVYGRKLNDRYGMARSNWDENDSVVNLQLNPPSHCINLD